MEEETKVAFMRCKHCGGSARLVSKSMGQLKYEDRTYVCERCGKETHTCKDTLDHDRYAAIRGYIGEPWEEGKETIQ